MAAEKKKAEQTAPEEETAPESAPDAPESAQDAPESASDAPDDREAAETEKDAPGAPEAAETDSPHAPGVPTTVRYRCVQPQGCTIVANWPGGSQRSLSLAKGDTLDVPTAVGRWLDSLGWKKAASNARAPKPDHH